MGDLGTTENTENTERHERKKVSAFLDKLLDGAEVEG
jgi:hypothetical protein